MSNVNIANKTKSNLIVSYTVNLIKKIHLFHFYNIVSKSLVCTCILSGFNSQITTNVIG